MSDNQFAFQPTISTRGAIVAYKILLKRRLNLNRDSHLMFIDSAKAFGLFIKNTVSKKLLKKTCFSGKTNGSGYIEHTQKLADNNIF